MRHNLQKEFTIVLSITVCIVLISLPVTPMKTDEESTVMDTTISVNSISVDFVEDVHYEPQQSYADVHIEEVEMGVEIWHDSLEYIACCVEAEAGNQSELGKRLVCDVIINRYNSGGYKDFYEVVNDKNQFYVVSNGLIEEVIPSEETYRIVAEELIEVTNDEVYYFRTERYHNFGIPMFKEGDHYFSRGE